MSETLDNLETLHATPMRCPAAELVLQNTVECVLSPPASLGNTAGVSPCIEQAACRLETQLTLRSSSR